MPQWLLLGHKVVLKGWLALMEPGLDEAHHHDESLCSAQAKAVIDQQQLPPPVLWELAGQGLQGHPACSLFSWRVVF